MTSYEDFLARKQPSAHRVGIDAPPLNGMLFPFQRACIEFALHAGRCGMFLDTGLGKTAIQLEFLKHAADATNGRALLLAPLAVGWQIKREADRFGIEARQIREQSDARDGVNICNYDRLEKLDPDAFGAVSLDESSILKSFTGSTTRALISAFAGHRFRMAATATPAPNDHMELGTHAEYLGVMSSREMLSRWFINDASTASQSWRLKKHARESFWDWMSSWSRMAGTPADLGFSDRGYVLPDLVVHKHRIKNERYATDCGDLFGSAVSATSLFAAKRKTVHDRADMVVELVAAGAGSQWVVWCDTNEESAEICKRIGDAVEVKGRDASEIKEERLAAFADGTARVIVTKPSICGFGLNWQHCSNVIFAGRTFSYEAYYQAVRRCWRFGQRNPVHVHLVMTSGEDEISRVIDRKASDHAGMKDEMAAAMRRAIGSDATRFSVYTPDQKGKIPSWLTASDTPTETGSPHIKAIA